MGSNQVFRNNQFRYIDALEKPFPACEILTIPSWQDDQGTLGCTPTILTPDGDMMMLGGATLTVDNIIVNNPIVQDDIICETISARTADIIINDDLVMLAGTELKADTITQNVASATLILNELNIGDNSWRFFIDGDDVKIQFDGGDAFTYFRSTNTLTFQVPASPSPEMTITNGVVCANNKLQISGQAEVYLQRLTSGPDQDFFINVATNKLLRYDTSADNWEFDNNGTIELKIDNGNNRIEINNLLFAGINQSVLNQYEQSFDHVTKWAGPFPETVIINITLTRIGKTIIVKLPDIDETGNTVAAPIVNVTAIPIRFRPDEVQTFVINTFDNISLVGRCTIDLAGIFTITRTMSATDFDADVNQKGFRRTSFSYLLT